ncbi:hypothetical protein ZIOFF_038751 [Zingiber officinale]|uniref:Macro domain-containing protein n=1 Tax=Zingiber officinale TaxID=94328 RepID=A0A8J5FZZ3_ZINOF|nr:hypothetical protein ZIOFF_038751 [Zingiber officinale]
MCNCFIDLENLYSMSLSRKVIHTVGPKYAVKYHTAAENSLSHCYRSCLEILIENGLQRIATGCIYTEAKNYPREPAAHVAISIGETVIDERKIRIKPLPAPSVADATPTTISLDLPISDVGLTLSLESYLDPTFMSLIKDPDQSRIEQQERVPKLKVISIVPSFLDGDLSGPPLSAAEEPVMVVIGAHFLLRCLDLECFVLYVVKEFEPLIQKPYSIIYIHSAASLQLYCYICFASDTGIEGSNLLPAAFGGRRGTQTNSHFSS